MTRNNILPHSKTIKLSDGFRIKLHYDNLSNDKLQKAINHIKEVDSDYDTIKSSFKTLIKFGEPDAIRKPFQLYIYNDENSYHKHTGSTISYGHFDFGSNKMHIYGRNSCNGSDITLEITMHNSLSQMILP